MHEAADRRPDLHRKFRGVHSHDLESVSSNTPEDTLFNNEQRTVISSRATVKGTFTEKSTSTEEYEKHVYFF